MSEPKYVSFKALTGKIILEVIAGEYNDNTCVILRTVHREWEEQMYMIESGSSSSCGILNCTEINQIPEGFEKDETL